MPDGNYGIQLFNKYGYNVATVNDINFSLRSSGQIHNWQFGGGDPISIASMDFQGFNSPIVFLRPMWADQRVGTMVGDQFEFNTKPILEQQGYKTQMKFKIMKWWNKDIGSIQYYVFDRWIPPERSSYGMQLFDGGGSIVFDSGWHFMNLRSVIWLDPGYPNHSTSDPEGGNWSVVGSAGAGELAMAMPIPRGWVQPDWGGQGTYLSECFHFSDWDNKITISLVPRSVYLWQAPRAGWGNENSRSQIMVANVEGIPKNYNEVRIIPYGSW